MHRWFAALAFDVGLIVAAIITFEIWPGLLTGALAILLIGTRQHGIGVLAHDGVHRSICKNRWLNDALAQVCFWLLGISLTRYRAFHLAHHRFVGTALDPERALKAGAAPAWDMPANMRHILTLCAKDFLVWPALREIIPFMRLVASPGATLAAIAIWGGVAWLFGWVPVALWLTALATAFWASFRFRVWTEHQGTDGTNCVRMTWWQRFLFAPHRIGWHAEHHAAPGVPFYELPGRRCQRAIGVGELFARYAG